MDKNETQRSSLYWNGKQQDIVLDCEKAVAYDSPDHIMPHGTKWNNSTNRNFNDKLRWLYLNERNETSTPINILDLGCAGGGFVKDCIDDGNFAIGLEGSDYSKRMGRAEWKVIPQNLFTCDISRKFDIYDGSMTRIKFDIITSWEVMEHIKEDALPTLAENIARHLDANGLVIMSITNHSDFKNGIELHQTQQPKGWWLDMFSKHGLVCRNEYLRYFNSQYVDHIKRETDRNFHLILAKKDAKPPKPPKLGASEVMSDWYRGSRIQKGLEYIITGDYKFK